MEHSENLEKRQGGSEIENVRLGDGSFLLSYIKSSMLSVPRKYRKQKAFFRFLQRSVANAAFLETIDHFRDFILRSTLGQQDQTSGLIFALSGVKGGEGASFLSFMLALSMGACTSRRVAFFDGRFNTQRFDALSTVLGLSENLFLGSKGSSKILGYCKIAQPNVYFLRNVGDEQSLEFFSDKRLKIFLGELRQNFDFTFIDMPPFLKEASCSLLAAEINKLYLVAEAGVTRRSELEKCAEMACQTGVEIAGIILNKQKAPLWTRLFWRDYFFSPMSFVPPATSGFALARIKGEEDLE